MQATATFNHNGVEILLLANGKFAAQTPTGRITAASLDAIKKRLDKPAEFEPFKAFYFSSWGKQIIVECTVIGIAKSRKKYEADKFITDKGERQSVFADTPENRAAAQAYLDMRERHIQIRRQQDEAERVASDAIATLQPSDLAKAA